MWVRLVSREQTPEEYSDRRSSFYLFGGGLVVAQKYFTAAVPCVLLGIVLGFANCQKQTSNGEVMPQLSVNEARQLSDAVAQDLINERTSSIRDKAEHLLREQVDEGRFASMVGQIYEVYGKPLELEFKHVDQGQKRYQDGRTKDMWKFWYAARTSKFEKGRYFLFVEVVNDGPVVACSSFAFVSFDGDVPPNLR
jgi:hypothetical protein